MKVLKKTGVPLALLALGVVLGALLVGPADVVLGQDNAQRFVIAYPPTTFTFDSNARDEPWDCDAQKD